MHVILMKIMVKELWIIWKIVETKEAKERSIPIMHEDYVILSQVLIIVLIIEEPHSFEEAHKYRLWVDCINKNM